MNKIFTIAYTFLLSLSVGCQPQQTDIVTEIHNADGSVTRYVNKSNGFGYNPNATSNLNIGGVNGANNAVIASGYGGGWGGYPYYGGGWGYGWGGWGGGWGGCGYYGGGYGYGGCYIGVGNQGYGSTGVQTPGAAPIPNNMNVYGYNPVVNWNGGYYPANPTYRPSVGGN